MKPEYQSYLENAEQISEASVASIAEVKKAVEEFVNKTLMIGEVPARKVKSVKKTLPRKLSLDLSIVANKDEKFTDKLAASILKKIKKENWNTLEIGWDPDKEDSAYIKAT